MKAIIKIFNDQENYKKYEDWIIVIDGNDFYIFWEDNEFDIPVSEAWKNGMFDNVKWTHDSARVMLIGLFTIGLGE